MKRIGILTVFIISLLALPATAEEPQDGFEILLARLDPSTLSRIVTDSHPWSRLPQEEPIRPISVPSRVHMESNDTLTALNFSTAGSISPYIGAGIGHEEPPIHDPSQPLPIALRFGAGFGCDLDSLTRFFINYSFQFSPDSQFSQINPRFDENHNLSFGLQFTF